MYPVAPQLYALHDAGLKVEHVLPAGFDFFFGGIQLGEVKESAVMAGLRYHKLMIKLLEVGVRDMH